jgi:hypothetical protein
MIKVEVGRGEIRGGERKREEVGGERGRGGREIKREKERERGEVAV